MTPKILAADARNRALRTFLQGLGYTAAAAAVMVLLPVFTSARSWGDFDLSVIGFALVQSCGMAVLAWLMRTYLDRRTNALRGPDERGVFDWRLMLVIAAGVVLGWLVIQVLVHVLHLHIR